MKILYTERYVVMPKPYRFRNFLLDILMVTVTGGLWLIWIFCRELRK